MARRGCERTFVVLSQPLKSLTNLRFAERICPTACKSDDLRPAVGTGMHFYVSHRPALRLRGVPALRTPFGRVLAPSALRAFTFSQAFALQKMPEMTYTPSFLMRASFFRDFVNTLRGCERTFVVLSQPLDFLFAGFPFTSRKAPVPDSRRPRCSPGCARPGAGSRPCPRSGAGAHPWMPSR